MADKRELKYWLQSEGFPKYKEATKLSTEDSKNDPETEPYKSKYAAREILLDLAKNVEEFVGHDDNPEDIEAKLKALKFTIQYDLALNYIETLERGTGERYLNEIKDNLQDSKLQPQFCSLFIKCCQQLGILWNERGEFERSLTSLNEAEKLYSDYKSTGETPPSESLEHFQTDDVDEVSVGQQSSFENLHTHTLFYLTQVYKNLGENKKSSRYCHNTLRRQLLTKLYVPADWAVNCATLSQYHITQEDYKSARHCLVCANVVIAECPEVSKVEEPSDSETEGEDDRQAREHIPQARANVALCWSKYCLDLLRSSADRLNGAVENGKVQNKRSSEEILRFDSLDVTELESEVPCEIVKDYDQARLLFLAGQKYLNAAKEFYKLDGYVTNYIEIIQDHSQLYKQLTFFDPDVERQCKMCKRRIDMLCAVLGELNPQHYLLVCRQLIFEIATVYGDMADLKCCLIAENKPKPPTPHQIKKINSLLENSAKFYTSFLDSLKHDGKLPEKYDESVLRVALLAHLCLARAHSKKLSPEPEERIGNYTKSLELYKYIVEYCDRDEDGAKCFHEELQACRDMVELLPFRLAKIAEERE